MSKHPGKSFLNNYGEFPNFSVKYYLTFTFLFLRDASYPILMTPLHFWEWRNEGRLGDARSRGWKGQREFGNGEVQAGGITK